MQKFSLEKKRFPALINLHALRGSLSLLDVQVEKLIEFNLEGRNSFTKNSLKNFLTIFEKLVYYMSIIEDNFPLDEQLRLLYEEFYKERIYQNFKKIQKFCNSSQKSKIDAFLTLINHN